MSYLTSQDNGQRPQDTQGSEGWQVQEPYEASSAVRDHAGEEGRDRLVWIENVAEPTGLLHLRNCKTTEDVVEQLYLIVPKLNHPALGLRIMNKPMGGMGRESVAGPLAYDQEYLYISVYLRKHT